MSQSITTPVTPPTRGLVLPCPTSPSKASFSYKMTVGNEVSDDTLKLCTNLFSSNYGIWGDQAATISKFTVAWKQVKMTGASVKVILKAKCILRASASARTLCPLLKYCPLFQEDKTNTSRGSDK
ncbi:uncharacterized protein BJ212DRAFT_1488293 [Suillus subaureus]|uniref:Uncharacterized protein n=1 Tax=Suillus subaureus TaxID=48587 RepID=A0A9P7DP44_9AGAM|nr:uncharacterized protein BJ212DRAFT_1488293 [Suillus subaureus]KAG1799575.1 hypothetical protein BJ212DRAFT_1488293 [Suillus subaureus]